MNLIRVHLTRSTGFISEFQVQRITDPAQSTQWATWMTLPGSAGIMFQEGGCAVVNAAGTLYAFAQRGTGGNDLWSWSSLDNGQSWQGPVTVVSPPGGALLNGIGSAGNGDVFFLYDSSGGVAVGYSFLSGVTWSPLQSWTLPTLPAGRGIIAVWNGTAYILIYSDNYSIKSCIFTPLAGTWIPGTVIVPSTTTAIGRLAPRLTFADGLYTLTCIEIDTGVLTGAVYHYPRIRQSLDLVHWSDGMIVPDLPSLYGAIAIKIPASQHEARYYISTLPAIYSAPAFQDSEPTQFLDVSPSVLSYRREERVGQAARLEIVLDNGGGAYNLAATNGPIIFNSTLSLQEGYHLGGIPGSAQMVAVGSYMLETLRFERSRRENRIVLIGFDRSRLLDRIVRYQNTYIGQTVGFLIREVCARAGLFAIILPGTSQLAQIVPSFILQANQGYRRALDELCATYRLAYFLDQNDVLRFLEVSIDDPPIWNYQPEIEQVSFEIRNVQANHIIVHGKPPIIGQIGELMTAEVYDEVHLREVGVEHILFHVDTKLTTGAQCTQKAAFLLAQQRSKREQHTVVLPLNPALQLLDVITLTDSVSGSGQQRSGRIRSLQALYDAHHALVRLELTVESL